MRSKPLYKVSGEIYAPPSKSAMVRALAGALISEGKTVISNPSYCDDALAALNILKDFGCKIDDNSDNLVINSENISVPKVINANESALTLHLFTMIRAFYDDEYEVVGEKTILNREFNQLIDTLKLLGKNVESNYNQLPFKISGKIAKTDIRYDFSSGSQALSGLLFLFSMLKKGMIGTNKIASKNYVDLTFDMLSYFGYKFEREQYKSFKFNSKSNSTGAISIEGDWSGAAFLLVSAAVSGNLQVNNLKQNSKQADIRIMDALRDYGAEISFTDNSVSIKSSKHNAFEFDASDCPDLFPPLLALALSADGKSVIHGAHRLRNKESDRAAVLVKEFSKLGTNVYIEDDDMIIEGSELHSGTIDSHGDHRIAMAARTAEIISSVNIEIIDPNCVSKSYPNFYKDIEQIRKKL